MVVKVGHDGRRSKHGKLYEIEISKFLGQLSKDEQFRGRKLGFFFDKVDLEAGHFGGRDMLVKH